MKRAVDGPLTDWLLRAETPSIRLITLRDLLERPNSDFALRQAVQDVAATGPVPAIMAAQESEGYWFSARHFYSPKYRSTHWSMLLLTELGADPLGLRFRAGADAMLSTIQTDSSSRLTMGKANEACFYGNMLRYAAAAGMLDDPRTETVIAKLVSKGIEDQWVCPHFGNGCLWGILRALWGLSTLPQEMQTRAVKETIRSGLRFLLEEHSFVDGTYPRRSTHLKNWHKAAFPHFAHADLLFALRVLADLDELDHPSAKQAVNWLLRQRRSDGRWHGINPFASRTWDLPGGKEDTDRWVSLHAAMVLKHAS